MNTIKVFWQNSDKYFLVPIIFSVFSCLLIGNLYLIFYPNLPDKLPLFYSLSWGQSQLVGKQQIFLLPAILILVTLINSLLASQLHNSHFALKRILMLSLFCTNIIILVTSLKIIMIFS